MESDSTLTHEELLQRLSELATQSLSLWDLPAGAHCRLINVSENATYLVEAEGGYKAILRVHRENYHSRNAISCELAWMEDLNAHGGVITPGTIVGKNGEVIQQSGIESLPAPRYLVLFEFIEGVEPDESQDLAAPFEELGEIAAKTHVHSISWEKPAGFERLVWNLDAVFGSSPTWGNWRNAPRMTSQKQAVMQTLEDVVIKRLQAFGDGPERYGLIHADMRLANLLVHESSTRLIDFDDCGLGWFLYDFAAAISFMEDSPQIPILKSAWVKGYRKVRELSDVDVQEIDTFIMLRRMALCAWMGTHQEVDIVQEMSPTFTQVTVDLAEQYLSNL